METTCDSVEFCQDDITNRASLSFPVCNRYIYGLHVRNLSEYDFYTHLVLVCLTKTAELSVLHLSCLYDNRITKSI